MIKTYSKKRDGETRLSHDFRVKEFACKDGSDEIYIDSRLVDYLQRIRNWAGHPIVISSGYRTPEHNAKIGGSKTSYHTKGRAADIYVKDRKKSIYEIARYAQAIGVPGIEENKDSNYVHIDTRPDKYYWIHEGSRDRKVTSFGEVCKWKEPSKNLKYLSDGDGVKWLQYWLILWGYELTVDGKFGSRTDKAVRDVQKRRGLKIDGIAGAKTRAALKGD